MGQKKLIRFQEIESFSNVLQYPKDMQGRWKDHFNNDHPITLELACGKGEYAVGMGRLYPEQNFIGIDVKGNRIWRGAKTAISEGLNNVAFVRSKIDKVADYFAKGEVAAIWITFPDPQLRFSKMKKRLTHPRFLREYRQFLLPGGLVHLKTDSPDLYNFTKAVINLFALDLLCDYEDVYKQPDLSEDLKIKTHYEGLDIAKSNCIHYLQFLLNTEMPKEKDEILKNLFSEQQPD